MLHRASDYTEQSIAVLQEYQQAGDIKNLGVSLYKKTEFENIRSKEWIDCVQAPFSLVDTRMDADYFQSSNSSISLQIRSLYLQGLLLQSVSELPDFVPILKQELSSLLKEMNQEKLTPNQLIRFSLDHSQCDDVVLGFENKAQLKACFEASDVLPIPRALAIPELEYLPSNWPT